MQEIQYIGEHLLPGQLGHFAIVLSFVTAMLAAAAYFFATQKRQTPEAESWRNIGRIGFAIHGFSILSVIGIIFYIMVNQYYEYHYVWAHVSDDLPFKYIASAFWEGQEGSFLLWMFWHVVLGFVLMLTAKQWESPVMASLALIQVFITSMIQGIHIGFGDWVYKLGINPLLLLRDTMDIPLFNNADYLNVMQGGTGLNPLLQNYWMTIHPPTLFLGFASTAVPFCFAVAGLWTRQHKAWLKPVLPWALFSGGMLGTGILMGGAWAYEALSFGGYWAWDPVENMSLVPWLILLAGIHTNLIAKATGRAIKTSYIFYLMTFVLIVYSTFMTRSGVLGDTSVHAFTEMGLETQLLAFLLAFLFFSIFIFFRNSDDVPVPAKEEAVSSREFWMFIGSLVFLFSSVLITLSTSLPVYNKLVQLFDPLFEGRVINDPVAHYNKYQLWIGVFIGLLTGVAQFTRFRESNFEKHGQKFWTNLCIAAAVSAVLTYVFTMWIHARAWQYQLLLFSGIFAVITNLQYLIAFTKANTKTSASAISHIGFGLMVIGVMASGLNKEYISNNEFVQGGMMRGFTPEQYRKNIMLLKGEPLLMNGYEVTYVKDSIWGHHREFQVNYTKRDDNGRVIEAFDLFPNVLYEQKEGKIAASNPSTKHYLDKDIFTHVASLPASEQDREAAKAIEDSLTYETHLLAIGDTLRRENYILVLESINKDATHRDYDRMENDLSYGAQLVIYPKKFNAKYEVQPVIALRQTLLYNYAEEVPKLNLKIKFPEAALEQLFATESSLGYQPFTIKKGATVDYKDYKIRFDAFNVQPRHKGYIPQEGDIVVGAQLSVFNQNDQLLGNAEPVFLIRGKAPLNFKDELFEEGLHFRFTKINPATEEVDLMIGHHATSSRQVPIAIAEDMPRRDWIVLEAIVFPGINFFWVGSIMMMAGLFLGMVARRKH